LSVQNLITDHIETWTTAKVQKTKGGRGRKSNNQNQYGVKKLRELILELAVRGKLVPQDPNDEPASVLLEKIIEEQDRLISDHGLRTKAKVEITQQEEYLTRQQGWSYYRLGNIARFIDYRGRTPKKIEAGIPLITAKNIRFGYISREPREFITEAEYNEWMTRGFPKIGDILFTTEAPLGNVALVDIEEKFALAQRAICFQLHVPEIAHFLKVLIMSRIFQNQLIENATGMTATGIKSSKLKEIPIPLPPLPEQHRIVAKVDELMALCDQLEQEQTDNSETHQLLVKTLLDTLTHATDHEGFISTWKLIEQNFNILFTTEASIDELKQTILQLAVMGKLVPQDPNDEPARVLLQKIAKEKAHLVKEGKIKKQKPLPEISEDEKPFGLPKSWEWSRLGEIALLKGGFAYKSTAFTNTGEHQVIRMGNIRPDYLRLKENPAYIPFELAHTTPEYEIHNGDILLTMTGTKGKRDYLYSLSVQLDHLKNTQLYLNQRLCIVRGMYPMHEFINKVMKDDRLLTTIYSKSTGTANQANIGMVAISNWVLPFPPQREQNRILDRVDELMVLCDSLKKQLNDAQTTQVQLADAIVGQIIT